MKYIILLLALVSLNACGMRSEEEIRALHANPAVLPIGKIDGCDVKYVDRGTNVESFYIARCDKTTTTTNNYYQSVGKSQVFRRSTDITVEIDKLQQEKKAAEAKEKAMSKLTPEDQKTLGISK